MNLASLATVTQRLNCSASVGNLWPLNGSAGANSSSSSSQMAPRQRSEIAQVSGDSHNVKPIEYVVRGTFDDYDYQSDSNNNHSNSISININNSQLAKSDKPSQSGSRKSLAKEKKSKRHKDGEKIEKLRILVSYLRSGSGNNLPHPVALEPDELELAQKYKSHLILCDECLKVAEQQQQQRERDSYLLLGLVPTRSTPSMSALAGQSRVPAERLAGSSDALPVSPVGSTHSHLADIAVDVCQSSENTSVCGRASSSGASQSHLAHLQHHQQHPEHSQHSTPKMFYIDDMEHKNCNSSDTSNSQLGVSRSQSACLADDASNSYRAADADDEADSASGPMGVHYAPRGRRRSANASSAGMTVSRSLPLRSWSSELFLSSTPTTTITITTTKTTSSVSAPAATTTPTVPKISSSPVEVVQLANPNNNTHLSCGTDSSPKTLASHRTSAWTTPQNLASWIDDEVNSLVNDLETESQLVKSEKLAKSSKRKWLTGNPIRRNSSGAHST